MYQIVLSPISGKLNRDLCWLDVAQFYSLSFKALTKYMFKYIQTNKLCATSTIRKRDTKKIKTLGRIPREWIADELKFVAGSDSRKLHSLDPRPCEECGRVYSNLSNLRQHMKLIHFPTYVQCHLCKKTFKTDLYLRRHIISSHDGLNRGLVKSSAVLQDNYGHCVNTKNNNLDPFQFRSKIT